LSSSAAKEAAIFKINCHKPTDITALLLFPLSWPEKRILVALAVFLAVLALVGWLGTKPTDLGFIFLGFKEFDLACLGSISRMDGVHENNDSSNFLFN